MTTTQQSDDTSVHDRPTRGRVVVGIDGSPGGLGPLRYVAAVEVAS